MGDNTHRLYYLREPDTSFPGTQAPRQNHTETVINVGGRFTVTRDEEELIKRFEVSDTIRETRLVPRFNIAPSQSVAVIVSRDGVRALDNYKWGLIPFWVKDLKKMKPMINAKSETLMEKPFFKTALTRRRCLIC